MDAAAAELRTPVTAIHGADAEAGPARAYAPAMNDPKVALECCWMIRQLF